MVICPLMQAVTFIDQDGAVRTYKLIDLQRNGCSKVDLSFLQVTTTLFLQFSRQSVHHSSLLIFINLLTYRSIMFAIQSQVARLRYASTMIERLLKQCNAGQTGRLYSSQNLNPAQSVRFSKLRFLKFEFPISRIVGKYGRDVAFCQQEKDGKNRPFKMRITPRLFNVKGTNVGKMIKSFPLLPIEEAYFSPRTVTVVRLCSLNGKNPSTHEHFSIPNLFLCLFPFRAVIMLRFLLILRIIHCYQKKGQIRI